MAHAPASESADGAAAADRSRDAVDRSTGRTLVIWNPDAGGDGGEVEQRLDELRAALARHGIDAEVLAGATHVSEGRFQAALRLLRTGLRSRRTRLRLQLDGREVRTRALSIAVANGRFTGRGLELAPEASLDDDRFDVLVFEGFGPLGLGVHLARVLLGRKHDERIARYTAATVRISTHRPLPIRVDSQDLGTTPAALVTRRAALRVIAPASR
jgi:diacylglycerol kinase family enzyme